MMDTCIQAIVIVLALALTGCGHDPQPPSPAPTSTPPYSACLPRPAPLPPIATVEQVRERHDRLDTLYLDCASRLKQTLNAWPGN